MKRTLIYRPDALIDLNEAERYTLAAWGRTQAKLYVATLVADIKALRVSALRYPVQDDVFAGLRRKRSGMHHIYYLATESSVEVLNIIHVSRDPAQHLKMGDWRED
jgi:plasmid stabilization system protein ParE